MESNNPKNKKFYCDICHTFPDVILESCFTEIKREWDGTEYKEISSMKATDESVFFCETCGSQVDEDLDLEKLIEETRKSEEKEC